MTNWTQVRSLDGVEKSLKWLQVCFRFDGGKRHSITGHSELESLSNRRIPVKPATLGTCRFASINAKTARTLNPWAESLRRPFARRCATRMEARKGSTMLSCYPSRRSRQTTRARRNLPHSCSWSNPGVDIRCRSAMPANAWRHRLARKLIPSWQGLDPSSLITWPPHGVSYRRL